MAEIDRVGVNRQEVLLVDDDFAEHYLTTLQLCPKILKLRYLLSAFNQLLSHIAYGLDQSIED